MGWYLAALFAVALILVLLLALWFSMRLAAPQVDIDMALVEHAPVSRMPDAGDQDQEEEEPPARTRAAGGRS